MNDECLAVDVKRAGEMTGLSARSIQNYIALKILPSRKIGRRRLIPVSALENFLRHDQPSPSPRKRNSRSEGQTVEAHG